MLVQDSSKSYLMMPQEEAVPPSRAPSRVDQNGVARRDAADQGWLTLLVVILIGRISLVGSKGSKEQTGIHSVYLLWLDQV